MTATADQLDETVETPPAPSPAEEEDEDYLEPRATRRSRVTTGLVVALVFVVGVLVGVLVDRALGPEPAPRVVYVLGDAPGSPAPTSLSPTPSGSR